MLNEKGIVARADLAAEAGLLLAAADTPALAAAVEAIGGLIGPSRGH